MQYLISVIDTGQAAAAGSDYTATPEEEVGVDNFNTRLQEEGYWVFAGGLGLPSAATVVDSRGGSPVVTDGPFVETKEFLAGFWIIEADDFDVVLRLAADASVACNRKIEVRPFQ